MINIFGIIIFGIVLLYSIVIIISPNKEKVSEMIGVILMLSIIFIAGIFSIFILIKRGYKEGKGKVYKRTKKGQNLNQKLEGLKNYLKDYSVLGEREAKELELWDEYLIYSVMFGQNKKIVEEYEKYIKINV